MTGSLNWFVLRGANQETPEECLSSPEDLGRREHIEKVLLETFRGSVVVEGEVVWTQPTLELRFKLGAERRPRRIDVEVLLNGIGYDEAIAALSTKVRGQLKERRCWQFFDLATQKPIRWNPAKQRPLSSLLI